MPEYLTLAEMAQHYRRTVKAIRHWRQKGIGPRSVLVEGRVLFPRAEVERYDREIQQRIQAGTR